MPVFSDDGPIFPESPLKQLSRKFPLFSNIDYERPLNNAYPPVGVDGNYPADLLLSLSAASVAHALGYSSIDYVRKTYAPDDAFENIDQFSETRVDRELRSFCVDLIGLIVDSVVEKRKKTEGSAAVGAYVAEATLNRLPFSIGRAFSEADRGALFESGAIARACLEQLAWSAAVLDMEDPKKVRALAATKCISSLKRYVPNAGSLYGQLSKITHWDYEYHIIPMFQKPGHVIHATPIFKAIAYEVLLLLTSVFGWAMIISPLSRTVDWEYLADKLSSKRLSKINVLKHAREIQLDVARAKLQIFSDLGDIEAS